VSLSSYNIDSKSVSVSGLSSGAFFATQLQVEYSSLIMGAGIVAGGPYDCARSQSYTMCMYSASPSITKPISNTKAWSATKIDDIANMARQRVFMFSGTQDSVVGKSVMDQLYKYYVTDGKFISASNVMYENTKKAAHTFPTDFASPGNNACGMETSPYISDCGYDGAGAILKHIYGTLNARNDGTLGGKFIEFDQAEFLANPTANGFDKTGWAYVPASCAAGQLCKLHIAFHGCLQGQHAVGDKFVKNTGYTKWADTNNIVLIFPQAVPTNTIGNGILFPNGNGCYDWIGWYGDNFDQHGGKQVTAVRSMITRLMGGSSGPVDPPAGQTTTAAGGGGTGQCYQSSNYEHVTDGRAYQKLGIAYALGSNDYMGLYNIFDMSELRHTGPSYYNVDNSC